jgi:hypothetical protein
MLLAGRVVGSIPDGVTEFFSIFLILPAALGSGVYSASIRKEYQKKMFLGSRERPEREADITTICELTV